MVDQQIATVWDVVSDRTSGRPAWAVVAAFVTGETGDPVCVEYRVRQVASAGTEAEAIVDAIALAEAMQAQSTSTTVPAPAAVSRRGIPRYVFEKASQVSLLEKARQRLALLEDQLERDEAARAHGEQVAVVRRTVSDAERRALAPPTKKTGRPPERSLLEKLRILAATEVGQAEGRTLEDIATDFHMSRSGLRDLLSWARKDADPRLFTGSGQGRKGGTLTDAARRLLVEMEGE